MTQRHNSWQCDYEPYNQKVAIYRGERSRLVSFAPAPNCEKHKIHQIEGYTRHIVGYHTEGEALLRGLRLHLWWLARLRLLRLLSLLSLHSRSGRLLLL